MDSASEFSWLTSNREHYFMLVSSAIFVLFVAYLSFIHIRPVVESWLQIDGDLVAVLITIGAAYSLLHDPLM
jgi:uncharacterized membrane protein (DUF485 family)